MAHAEPNHAGIASEDLEARLRLAIDAARTAGDLTLEYFQTRDIGLEHKSDGSPVTRADREAEAHLRERIAQTFPEDAVLGEEMPGREGSSGYRWILDPIDGTKSFVHGVPLYGTLIGLQHGADFVAGVIRIPALDEMVYGADGFGAWHVRGNAEPSRARVSATKDLSQALICSTSIEYFEDAGATAKYARLASSVGAIRGWSDCYGALLTATGRADAWVEPVLNLWDAAAVFPIIREAGGLYTDWEGVETPDSPNGLASNGLIHEGLRARLVE